MHEIRSNKWPVFITGFVLGILVTLGVVGLFGWQKYQQARAEAEAARAEAEILAERDRQNRRFAEERLREAIAATQNTLDSLTAGDEGMKESLRKSIAEAQETLDTLKVKDK